MIEWVDNANKEYEESIFENLVLFTGLYTRLKKAVVPKFIESVVDQCETTLNAREKGKYVVGGLVVMNVTINLNKKSDSESTEPEEIKPNIILAPIKITPMDDVKIETLDAVFKKLGGPCSKALIEGYGAKPNTVVGMHLPLQYLGYSLEEISPIIEKHLTDSPLMMRIYK